MPGAYRSPTTSVHSVHRKPPIGPIALCGRRFRSSSSEDRTRTRSHPHGRRESGTRRPRPPVVRGRGVRGQMRRVTAATELRGATVHPDTRTAIVLGGSHWNDVLAAAAPRGLTAPHGSAGDFFVAGYSLNGGVSFYARAYGLRVNAVRAVQLVTADGSLVRARATRTPTCSGPCAAVRARSASSSFSRSTRCPTPTCSPGCCCRTPRSRRP